jgi:hypothetical protein
MAIAGTRFRHDFTLKDKDTGAVIDISGYELEIDIVNAQTRQLYTTLTMGSGVAFVSDGTDGELRLTLSAAQTLAIGAGMVRYVVRRVDEDNDLLFEGSFALEDRGYDAR